MQMILVVAGIVQGDIAKKCLVTWVVLMILLNKMFGLLFVSVLKGLIQLVQHVLQGGGLFPRWLECESKGQIAFFG